MKMMKITQGVGADLLNGKFSAAGKLPVSVCDSYKAGDGIVGPDRVLPLANPSALGFDPLRLQKIDFICAEAIAKQATPGCVALVVKDGQVVYEKAFDTWGTIRKSLFIKRRSMTWPPSPRSAPRTMAVMKLVDEGRLDIQKTLGDYLPWTRGSNKQGLKIWDVLLHQAGLKAFIPFYKETIDSSKEGIPLPGIYAACRTACTASGLAEICISAAIGGYPV